jgi:hypothetical protein
MNAEFLNLLERTGARIHGRRADCPECGAWHTVSIDEDRGLFCCHHAGCNFEGNLATLQRRLGIRRQWLPRSEYRRQRRQHERAKLERWRAYEANRNRRLQLLDELQELNRLEMKAHEAGPDHPATWGALALCYRQREAIEAELDELERG